MRGQSCKEAAVTHIGENGKNVQSFSGSKDNHVFQSKMITETILLVVRRVAALFMNCLIKSIRSWKNTNKHAYQAFLFMSHSITVPGWPDVMLVLWESDVQQESTNAQASSQM